MSSAARMFAAANALRYQACSRWRLFNPFGASWKESAAQPAERVGSGQKETHQGLKPEFV
jgi:hypothetical protein